MFLFIKCRRTLTLCNALYFHYQLFAVCGFNMSWVFFLVSPFIYQVINVFVIKSWNLNDWYYKCFIKNLIVTINIFFLHLLCSKISSFKVRFLVYHLEFHFSFNISASISEAVDILMLLLTKVNYWVAVCILLIYTQ